MGFFSRLFGKKEMTGPATPPSQRAATPPASTRPAPTGAASGAAGLALEQENLRRWRESGQPRAWVEARRGQWTHQDWLELLESLQRSPYWPMKPNEVGRVLEDLKPRHPPSDPGARGI